MQFLSDLGHAIVNVAVHAIAWFTAQILNHPLVVDAAANVIVVGLKKLCHEPDLDDHVEALSNVLSKRMEREALKAGRDFPKVVGHFVKGMMSHPSPDTPTSKSHHDASMTELSLEEEGVKKGAYANGASTKNEVTQSVKKVL
ncbi:hypothetical protein MHU86_19007 [Fragilaria crotonensis]|nr:hypothetical protein MHU86_19007 [Fragilaria crotonensis]